MSDNHHIFSKNSSIFRLNFNLFCLLIIVILSGCAQTNQSPPDQSSLFSSTPLENLKQLGNKSFDEKKYETAVIYYKQALQNGADPEIYARLAESYEALNNRDAALDIWLNMSMLTDITAQEKESYKINSITNHIKLGQLTAAANLLSTLNLETQKTRKFFLLSGLIHVLKNEKNAAINNFEAVLAQYPEDQSALINLGLAYLVFNDLPAALQKFQQLKPTTIKATNIILTYLLANQLHKAELQKSQVQMPQDTFEQLTAYADRLRNVSSTERALILFQIKSIQ